MKIIFPELKTSPTAKEAVKHFHDISFISTDSLEHSSRMLAQKQADSMITGLDYPSRDVILALKSYLPLQSRFFSSCFICKKEDKILALADGGINKTPNRDQLYTTIEDTAHTFTQFTKTQPRIAMLSYSTHGSGGKNPDLEKIHFCINRIRQLHPSWLIDGEMQLDCAINPEISQKKFPTSTIQGQANILIVPDLNSGNILYKSLERFADFTIAGPIIQGFEMPIADLSRGSTIDDVIFTIKVLRSLL